MTAEPNPTELEEEELRQLLRDAGPRPEVPAADLQAVREAVQREWSEATGRPTPLREDPGTPGSAWWLLAATIALTVGTLAFWFGRGLLLPDPEVSRPPVAVVANVHGEVMISAQQSQLLERHRPVRIEDRITTGADGTVALHWPDGLRVRLAPATELRTIDRHVLELLTGRIYVDTGDGGGHSAAIEVRTAAATVHDIGTQFQVVVDPDGVRVAVHVREGATRIVPIGAVTSADPNARPDSRALPELTAQAGESAVVSPTEAQVTSRVGGPELWRWTLDAAAPLDLDGVDLVTALQRSARELGLRVRWADGGLENTLQQEQYFGPPVPAAQALGSVLEAAGLRTETLDDEIVVSARP